MLVPLNAAVVAFLAAGLPAMCGENVYGVLNVIVAIIPVAGNVPVVTVMVPLKSVPDMLIVGDDPAAAPAAIVGLAELPIKCGREALPPK